MKLSQIINLKDKFGPKLVRLGSVANLALEAVKIDLEFNSE